MTDRYDAVISRKGKDGKWRNTKIGAAFPSKKIEGAFNIVLDALPMPNAEGQAWITLFVPKPRDGDDAKPSGKQGGKGDDMNDEIPF